MSNLFGSLLDELEESVFEETPAELEDFLYNEKYLNLKITLSEHQKQLILTSSQIYKYETLVEWLGEERAKIRFSQTFKEIIYVLGKGCHAPYTPVYNPMTGKWESLDSLCQPGPVASSEGIADALSAHKEGFGQMLRVKTSLGFEEDVYLGHKYLGYRRSKFYKRRDRNILPEYIYAGEISVGDRVAIGLGMDVENPKNIPSEHAELIGYWLGDGCMPTDSNPVLNMDFSRNEKESIQRYEELCEYIGDSPRRFDHPVKNMTIFVHRRNSPATVLAKQYGLWGARAKDKAIPDEVWASSNTVLAKTVEKLWQTDGCVYSRNGNTAEFVSISQQLSEDVQKALLRLGVPASIRSRTPRSNFENASRAWYVTVSSQECYEAFVENIKLLDHKRIQPVEKQGRVYRRLENGVYYDRITSIIPVGEGEYWTKPVPMVGNYVGNGMISSNSGKDLCSEIALAYVVHQLLCLKEPAEYYGKDTGDAIDIINVAINADQANNVFFGGFKRIISKSPWFIGKFKPTQRHFGFDKNINVYSGHSEAEAFEGYNTLFVVLDEIAGFDTEGKIKFDEDGNRLSKAKELYDMYSDSLTSRFPDHGKMLMLSFPRYKKDYIMESYKAAIELKETIVREHTFKINEELPDGVEGNEFTIAWEEDHIIKYKKPGRFCLKRPSWEINPTRSIRDYMDRFLDDPVMALKKYACMPPESESAFFTSREKIEAAFRATNAFDEDGRFSKDFQPIEGKRYFIHVDLARLHDRCAVALAHVDHWETRKIGGNMTEPAPYVKVDALKYWTPTKEKHVDFTDVREYILSLQNRGFNISLVTFDRWESTDISHELRQYGIRVERLSVAKRHYTDMAMIVHEGRLSGPVNDILINELLELKVMPNDKIDHPTKGSKDLSDAVCGAIFNAIDRTPRESAEVVVKTIDTLRAEVKTEPTNIHEETETYKRRGDKKKAPTELMEYLSNMRVV